MPDKPVLLYILIVACEVAFWLILLLGLVVRYVLGRPTLSKWLLRSLPLIDLRLLAWYKHAFDCVFVWFIFGPVWSLSTVRRGAQ